MLTKLHGVVVYFNNQPGMSAFVLKIEKLMSRKGKKEFLEVPMFSNYLFIETELNEHEFCETVKEIERNLDSTMRVLQSDTQTVLALVNDEKNLFESLLDVNHLIMQSIGIIVNSKLIVQEVSLVG